MKTSNDFEEALMNIEAFCKVLVDKISGVGKSRVKPEPIERLLRKKAVVEVYRGDVEGREPLIDFFEDEKQCKILALMWPLSNNDVVLNSNIDFTEIMIGKCLKIKIPNRAIDTNKIHINNKSWTLEIIIEKTSPLMACIST
ncbi:MAG: hypothetical protein QXS79_06545 [Candidatus Bathyarchaeia archaeon]